MTRPLHPLSLMLLEDMRDLRDEPWDALRPMLRDRLAAIEDAAEQVGRDQWRRASGHGADQWEALLTRLDLFEDADIDAVIAAIRAEATPTVEALLLRSEHLQSQVDLLSNAGVAAVVKRDLDKVIARAERAEAALAHEKERLLRNLDRAKEHGTPDEYAAVCAAVFIDTVRVLSDEEMERLREWGYERGWLATPTDADLARAAMAREEAR